MSSSSESIKESSKSPLDGPLSVFLVMRTLDYEGSWILGAYSSYEKAEKGLEEALNELSAVKRQQRYLRRELSIEEWTLDQFLSTDKPA